MRAAMAAKEPTEVKFRDRVFRVRPPMQWRQSAMEAVRAGRYNDWARVTFVNDLREENGEPIGSNDGQAFVDADLTLEEVVDFFGAYADAAGQPPGESQPSQG